MFIKPELLLYLGSALIILWGIAHLIPTKPVVNGFGSISADSSRIIVMEWISEGLTLCFLGFLVFGVTFWGGSANVVSIIVYRSVAAMLIIMAGLTLFTGARTAIIPIKICPVIKIIAAIFVLGGSIL